MISAPLLFASLSILYSSSFRRTTTIMGNGRYIPNGCNIKPCSLQRTHRSLPTHSWAFHPNLHLPQSPIHRLLCRSLRCLLCGKRRAFPGSLKPLSARSGPRDHIPLSIGQAYNGIVERRLDVGYAHGIYLLVPPFPFSTSRAWWQKIPSSANR